MAGPAPGGQIRNMTQPIETGTISENEIMELLNAFAEGLLVRSRFFRFWKTEGVHPDICKKFLVSFDSLVKSFPALIADGVARARDEETREVLMMNLYQERGEGDLSRTHYTIYRKFLTTAGIDTASIEENDFATEWGTRLSKYIQEAGNISAVLGALTAGEFLAQPVLGRIYKVLQSRYAEADQEYFTKHLDLETEHVRELTQLLAHQAEKEGNFREVLTGFKFGLSVWEAYFNRLADFLSKA